MFYSQKCSQSKILRQMFKPIKVEITWPTRAIFMFIFSVSLSITVITLNKRLILISKKYSMVSWFHYDVHNLWTFIFCIPTVGKQEIRHHWDRIYMYLPYNTRMSKNQDYYYPSFECTDSTGFGRALRSLQCLVL